MKEPKEFRNVHLNLMKGLSYWFWVREMHAHVVLINLEAWAAVWHNLEELWDMRIIIAIVIVLPLLYLAVPFLAAFVKFSFFRQTDSEPRDFIAYHQQSADYFTVVTALTRHSTDEDEYEDDL